VTKQNSSHHKLGTLSGVFIPNVLTILGIIFFLRLGWVVGQSGLIRALIIIGTANLITLLTSFSLAAISTNIQVKGGGAYYLISRSIGLQAGGAIGIPLYLSQAVSVAFYLLGFAEIFCAVFPGADPQVTALLVLTLFAVMAFIGVNFVVRIQYMIVLILGLALFSFFTGSGPDSISVNFKAAYTAGHSFWTVFAVFFPAVTGIMAGVSMSGDLKTPARSIPRGTIAAVLFTAAVYLGAAWILGARADAAALIRDKLLMRKISLFPVLITAGIWAATLSSALTAIMGAPRTMQALAADRVLPRICAYKLGSRFEPRLAVLVTFFIAGGVIYMGDLDLVAPVISMFFLNTYAMLNLTAGVERLLSSPNFRPAFKIHWLFSLLGAFGCYAAMFLINAWATAAAMVLSLLIFFYLKHRDLKQNWGDLREGIWFSLARFALNHLETSAEHMKNWKPNIMTFVANPANQLSLITLAYWLSKGKGIISLHRLLCVKTSDQRSVVLRKTVRKQLEKFLDENELPALAECARAPDFLQGFKTQLETYGLGRIRPNTVLLGWSDTVAGKTLLMKCMRLAAEDSKNTLLLKISNFSNYSTWKNIDIWWGGAGDNGDLMLMLAYLLSLNEYWHGCRLRVICLISDEKGITAARKNIKDKLARDRIDAEIIVQTVSSSVAAAMEQLSAETELTIIGSRLPEPGEEQAYAAKIESMVVPLKNVLVVNAGSGKEVLE